MVVHDCLPTMVLCTRPAGNLPQDRYVAVVSGKPIKFHTLDHFEFICSAHTFSDHIVIKPFSGVNVGQIVTVRLVSYFAAALMGPLSNLSCT